ncbi:acyltransferase family protein [Telmatospirillum siberiense]|nr:acyltransferase family protein [Telmatospirillum siberiense]
MDGSSATETTRLQALDNLRVFVIFLVVVLHGSICYMAYAPEWWYVLDPHRSMAFTYLVLLVDVPIMPAMFFLAGYFAFPSLAKRGAVRFVKDKLVRIGVPWAFGALVLAPPTAYMIYYSRNLPMSLATFWRTDFWGKAFQQSVYWFLGVLLLLFLLTALAFALSRRFAAWKPEIRRPTWRLFALFVLTMSAGSLLIGVNHPLDQWSHVYVLVYQPARVPLYTGYFILGIVACRQGWFTGQGYRPAPFRWLALCLAFGLLYLTGRIAFPATGQAIAVTAATVLLFNLFCFSSLMAGVALFQARLGPERFFRRSRARNSYGIYYLHPLFLYPLALIFVPLSLPLAVKAAAIVLLAYLASWGVSAAILTRLPGLRRMF